MPLQQTSGNVTADAYGGGVAAVPNYIEEVFSTWLFNTDTPNDVTIPNGIDLSGEGGLVWNKLRSDSTSHQLYDTERGGSNQLQSNTTNAQSSSPTNAVQFGSNGFTWLRSGGWGPNSVVSWTFRKQPKFFDVQTFTSNSSNGGTFTHNLGAVPGCLIVKSTGGIDAWLVWHRGLTGGLTTNLVLLNTTGAQFNSGVSLTATDTSITIPNGILANASSGYVAYLFAHNAGGFGLTGTDNVISCGSFSGNTTVDLGYEPQWVLLKNATSADNWYIIDNMRGWPVQGNGNANTLQPNTSVAEQTGDTKGTPTATGFTTYGFGGSTGIYIAIRRGPMKVPTSGTSVFAVNATTGNGSGNTLTTNFPVDLSIDKGRTTGPAYWIDRLRGGTQYIDSASTNAELTYASTLINFQSNTSIVDANYGSTINTYVDWAFGRAPSFFDEVCWTGTGSGSQAITHNLNAVPEFTITKRRSGTGNWSCFPVMFGVNTGIYIDSTAALQTNAALHPTLPTSTTYYTNDASWGDENIGGTFVTYLFATCAGVSKCTAFTGTGTLQTINCGFTSGARFVLIKRTDAAGDWYVWDSARGISSSTDPYLLLNSTAAEVTSTNWVDTTSTGFQVTAASGNNVNINGASYIALAIA